MHTNKSSQQYLWADVIRIVAIFLVVTTHTLHFPQSDTFFFFPLFLLFLLSKTSVPLFFMLSGALLLSKQESFFQFIKKRCSRIIPPWIFWSGVTVIATNFHTLTWNNFFPQFKSTFLTDFWFLPVLFSLYILTPFFQKIIRLSSRKEIFSLLLLWGISISFLPFLFPSEAFPFSTDNGIIRQIISYSGLFFLGYFLSLFPLAHTHALIQSSLLFICSLLPFLFFFPTHSFAFLHPATIVSSLCIFLFISGISTYWNSPFFVQSIRTISSFSFGIYLSHQLVALFLSSTIPLFTQLHSFLATLMIFLSSLLLTALLNHIPLIKHISN